MRIIVVFIVLLLIAGVVILGATIFLTASVQRKGQIMNEETKPVSTPDINNLTITVVYDNNPYKEGLETAWGFSALITGTEKTILFDTGGDGLLLLDNMKKLAIEPNSIDAVVLSHIHGDHTGGLGSFLEKNSQVTIYLPGSFPKRFKDNVASYGAKVVEVEQSSFDFAQDGEPVEPLKICENVYSTGQLGKLIKEQSLIIQTNKGLIIMTGCAHPGIVNTVDTAKELLKDDILLVMGGFHLEWVFAGKIEKIISAFKQWHVRYVGPCHCSGHKARALFEEHFGKNYINIGAGKVITMTDLQ